MSKNLRAIVHVESAAGLGHHQGISQVVGAMTKEQGFDVTVVSGTFVDPQKFYPTATVRSLPDLYVGSVAPYSRWTESGERVPYENFDLNRWESERTATLSSIYRDVKPHVFISEWWPFSRPQLDKELSAVHDINRQEKWGTLFATSVRDVLQEIRVDSKDLQAAAKEMCSPRLLHFAPMTDAVLVHSDPRLVPFSATFAHTEIFGDRIHHTGYVATDKPIRHDMKPEQRHVLVSAGSGSNGEYMMRLVLEAWDQAPETLKNLTWHLVAGPRYGAKKFDDLVKAVQARTSDVTCADKGLMSERPQFIISNYVPNFPERLADAALSISMGGYNTTMEVLQSEVPSVIIPKFWRKGDVITKYDPEQTSRSTLLDKLGMSTFVAPEHLTDPAYLVKTMQRALDISANPHPDAFKLDFDGARKSAELLRRLVEAKGQGSAAQFNS